MFPPAKLSPPALVLRCDLGALGKLSAHVCLQDGEPPKDPDMYVRVLRDYGEISFSMGSVVLKKGSTHFLPRAEADPLIREGVLCPSESGPMEAFNSSNDYM